MPSQEETRRGRKKEWNKYQKKNKQFLLNILKIKFHEELLKTQTTGATKEPNIENHH